MSHVLSLSRLIGLSKTRIAVVFRSIWSPMPA
jgi:hypothetical protein